MTPHRIAASLRRQPQRRATTLRRSPPSPILPRVPPRHLLPLHGHSALRARLAGAVSRGDLPSSLLIEGPRGVGKQQLALWLGRLLLCEDPENDFPVGESDGPKAAARATDRTHCRTCKLTESLLHPDLHWLFPRPRLKGSSDPDLADIREDMAEGIAERLANGGLYESPGGDEGIFVAAIRGIVQTAALKPAMARRKVFIIGDAERMVSQEGSDQAANAFLKLLEEPPADTTVILTSSEPGASAADRSLPRDRGARAAADGRRDEGVRGGQERSLRSSTCRRSPPSWSRRRRERRGASPSATPGPPRSIRRHGFSTPRRRPTEDAARASR